MVQPSFTIEQIVAKTADLPTIPAAALAVMRETNRPESCARTVAQHIKKDQALTVRVLRLANSAYYGLSRRVVDVNDAVVMLGMKAVHNLSMVASTYPWLSRPLKGYGLGPKEMWTHSFAVATGSELVAKHSGRVDPSVAFTAGLLHNVGKVALSIWLENRVQAFIALAIRDNLTFDEVERKVLGFDHCEVGGYLGELWNLPEDIVAAIRWHHHPNEADPVNLTVDAVHMGDFMTMSMGFGLGADGLRYDFCEDTMVRLGIRHDELDELLGAFIEAYEDYERLFEGFDSK
ncbi:MAG: HDOD domain-containing protein [Fimbriimonadaceae bacterium]|nr:HDOD domain-containing protein [Fimbriimonadaceae bacterium]